MQLKDAQVYKTERVLDFGGIPREISVPPAWELEVGSRVVLSPSGFSDWGQHPHQGNGGPGTVSKLAGKYTYNQVKWDNGRTNTYRLRDLMPARIGAWEPTPGRRVQSSYIGGTGEIVYPDQLEAPEWGWLARAIKNEKDNGPKIPIRLISSNIIEAVPKISCMPLDMLPKTGEIWAPAYDLGSRIRKGRLLRIHSTNNVTVYLAELEGQSPIRSSKASEFYCENYYHVADNMDQIMAYHHEYHIRPCPACGELVHTWVDGGAVVSEGHFCEAEDEPGGIYDVL